MYKFIQGSCQVPEGGKVHFALFVSDRVGSTYWTWRDQKTYGSACRQFYRQLYGNEAYFEVMTSHEPVDSPLKVLSNGLNVMITIFDPTIQPPLGAGREERKLGPALHKVVFPGQVEPAMRKQHVSEWAIDELLSRKYEILPRVVVYYTAQDDLETVKREPANTYSPAVLMMPGMFGGAKHLIHVYMYTQSPADFRGQFAKIKAAASGFDTIVMSYDEGAEDRAWWPAFKRAFKKSEVLFMGTPASWADRLEKAGTRDIGSFPQCVNQVRDRLDKILWVNSLDDVFARFTTLTLSCLPETNPYIKYQEVSGPAAPAGFRHLTVDDVQEPGFDLARTKILAEDSSLFALRAYQLQALETMREEGKSGMLVVGKDGFVRYMNSTRNLLELLVPEVAPEPDPFHYERASAKRLLLTPLAHLRIRAEDGSLHELRPHQVAAVKRFQAGKQDSEQLVVDKSGFVQYVTNSGAKLDVMARSSGLAARMNLPL